jgi:hypothetical protein
MPRTAAANAVGAAPAVESRSQDHVKEAAMAPSPRRLVVAVLTILAALVILFIFIASPAAGVS